MNQYWAILVFAGVAVGFVGFNLLLAGIFRPKSVPEGDKLIPYECGPRPIGDAHAQFNFRFFNYAVLFILFEVEIVLMLPWVIVAKSFGVLALVEGLVFVGVLVVGLIYAWYKGDLDWFVSSRGDGILPLETE